MKLWQIKLWQRLALVFVFLTIVALLITYWRNVEARREDVDLAAGIIQILVTIGAIISSIITWYTKRYESKLQRAISSSAQEQDNNSPEENLELALSNNHFYIQLGQPDFANGVKIQLSQSDQQIINWSKGLPDFRGLNALFRNNLIQPPDAASVGVQLFTGNQNVAGFIPNIFIDSLPIRKNIDLFIYYPNFPSEISTVPFELFRSARDFWGTKWGVIRVPGGNPDHKHAEILRRYQSEFVLPESFKLLVIVNIPDHWKAVDEAINEWLDRLPNDIEPEVVLNKRATKRRVSNLIACGEFDFIYIVAHHDSGSLVLYENEDGGDGRLPISDLSLTNNPVIFLNVCEASGVSNNAVRHLLASGAAFVISTLRLVEGVPGVKFGGLFFDAAMGSGHYVQYLNESNQLGIEAPQEKKSLSIALSWARQQLAANEVSVWSYMLIGQPEPRRLGHLLKPWSEKLLEQERIVEFFAARACIHNGVSETKKLIKDRAEEYLHHRRYEKIIRLLNSVPGLYRNSIIDMVLEHAEQLFETRQWLMIVEMLEPISQYNSRANQLIEQAQKGLEGDILLKKSEFLLHSGP